MVLPTRDARVYWFDRMMGSRDMFEKADLDSLPRSENDHHMAWRLRKTHVSMMWQKDKKDRYVRYDSTLSCPQ